MNAYLLIKTLHIISATILFGTGIGIAWFMLAGHRAGSPTERAFASRATVRADFFFTLPAVIVQPLTGLWLVVNGGFDWSDKWLVATYALYIVAGAAWIPVVFIQIRMKHMLAAHAAGGRFDEAAYRRLFRIWFALGWPAFGALLLIFWLMVAKPGW